MTLAVTLAVTLAATLTVTLAESKLHSTPIVLIGLRCRERVPQLHCREHQLGVAADRNRTILAVTDYR